MKNYFKQTMMLLVLGLLFSSFAAPVMANNGGSDHHHGNKTAELSNHDDGNKTAEWSNHDDGNNTAELSNHDDGNNTAGCKQISQKGKSLKAILSSMVKNNVIAGKGTATFTIPAGKCEMQLSFSSYTYPAGITPSENGSPFNKQIFVKNVTGIYGPGTYTVNVDLPACGYHQLDLYAGPVIQVLGVKGYPADKIIDWKIGGQNNGNVQPALIKTAVLGVSTTPNPAPDTTNTPAPTATPEPGITVAEHTPAPTAAPASVTTTGSVVLVPIATLPPDITVTGTVIATSPELTVTLQPNGDLIINAEIPNAQEVTGTWTFDLGGKIYKVAGKDKVIFKIKDAPVGTYHTVAQFSKVDGTSVKLSPVVVSVPTVSGGSLPTTATPWYNILLGGAALTLIGGLGWQVRKLRK